jgi:hypothetical protein
MKPCRKIALKIRYPDQITTYGISKGPLEPEENTKKT